MRRNFTFGIPSRLGFCGQYQSHGFFCYMCRYSPDHVSYADGPPVSPEAAFSRASPQMRLPRTNA